MTDASTLTADAANVELVREFWAALDARDFDAVATFMAPDGHYVDVQVKAIEPGARGPAEPAARLRLGIEPLNPMFAAAAMSLSSVSVIGNALRLRGAKL